MAKIIASSAKWGSYVVIGTILTTLELEPNTPLTQSCMGCNRCITACLGQCLVLMSLNSTPVKVT